MTGLRRTHLYGPCCVVAVYTMRVLFECEFLSVVWYDSRFRSLEQERLVPSKSILTLPELGAETTSHFVDYWDIPGIIVRHWRGWSCWYHWAFAALCALQ